MASTTLQTSKTEAFARSTWTGTYNIGGSFTYSNPTTGSDTITVTVPAALAGVTFTSAAVSYTSLLTKAGSRTVKFNDTNENVTNASMLQRLQNGNTSIQVVFRYHANGGTGGSGTFTGEASWSNFSVTVTYTAINGITGTATITSGGTVTYSVDTPSLASGETAVLGIYAQPSVAITGVTAIIRPGTLTAGQMTFSAARSIAAGSSGSFSFTLEFTPAVLTAMTNRVYAAQMQISFTTSGGSTYSSSWFSVTNADDGKAFRFIKTRSAPVISGITWSESGTMHITQFGNLVQGKTVPILGFTVTLDTAADPGITVGSRLITIDGKSYSPGENSCTMAVIAASGSVAFTITVTDSYGQTATYSGNVAVLSYTPPSLTGLDINRYASYLDSGGHTVYELDDDGSHLWFDGIVAVQTSLGSGTNSWTLKITPSGGTAITAVSNSSTASVTYTHERSFLTASYDNTTSYDFTVTLSDQLTTKIYEVNVPKAGGYFNVEKNGVAVGMRSTGTVEDPLFQSAYPAHFLNGIYDSNGNRVDVPDDDTGWQSMTLVGCTEWATDTPVRVRKKSGVIYIRGAIRLNTQMSSYAQAATNRTQIATLPSAMAPAYNYQFSIVAEARYIKLIIETDGKMYLMNHCGNAVGTGVRIPLTCNYLAD